MAIDATPGGAAADSYITLVDANTYFSARLHIENWEAASDGDKEAALQWAARVLDGLIWKGTKVNDVQALRWPRYSVLDIDEQEYLDHLTIPAFLSSAAAELAFTLLGSDITATPGTDGFKEIKVGEIGIKLDDLRNRPDMLPRSVSFLINPYLTTGSGGGSLPIVRT